MKGKRYLGIFFAMLLLVYATENAYTQEARDGSVFKHKIEGRIASDGGQSRGIAWGDYDNDGDPDLYVANAGGQWNALYRNNGDGTFKKLTDPANTPYANAVIHGGNSQGVNWVDYDNDGDLDLFVANRGEEPNFLLQNRGERGFERIESGPLVEMGLSISMACWADFDLDGDLDVFVVGYSSNGNKIFENTGDGNFKLLETSILNQGNGEARACACGDLDNDGLADLYVGNARTPNFLYRNLGNWEFDTVSEGHAVTDIGYSYGTSWADYDQDGDMDLFVANFDKQNFLYENDGIGNLVAVTDSQLTLERGGASKGHTWGDFDNDGTLDLFVANGTYGPEMQNFLYFNRGNGRFERNLEGPIAMHADTSAGTAWADYDRDGDLDLFVANWGGNDQINRFYENNTEGNNWLALRIKGTDSNSYGIGSKVQIYHNETSQTRWMYPVTGYGSQNDYIIHFGLGEQSEVDSLVVQWPYGNKDVINNPSLNSYLTIVEGGGIK